MTREEAREKFIYSMRMATNAYVTSPTRFTALSRAFDAILAAVEPSEPEEPEEEAPVVNPHIETIHVCMGCGVERVVSDNRGLCVTYSDRCCENNETIQYKTRLVGTGRIW